MSVERLPYRDVRLGDQWPAVRGPGDPPRATVTFVGPFRSEFQRHRGWITVLLSDGRVLRAHGNQRLTIWRPASERDDITTASEVLV